MSPASAFALAGSAALLLIWGLCPHALMDRAAGLAQGFQQITETGHTVHYFSLGNLKGGLISIGESPFFSTKTATNSLVM